MGPAWEEIQEVPGAEDRVHPGRGGQVASGLFLRGQPERVPVRPVPGQEEGVVVIAGDGQRRPLHAGVLLESSVAGQSHDCGHPLAKRHQLGRGHTVDIGPNTGAQSSCEQHAKQRYSNGYSPSDPRFATRRMIPTSGRDGNSLGGAETFLQATARQQHGYEMWALLAHTAENSRDDSGGERRTRPGEVADDRPAAPVPTVPPGPG